MLLPEDEHRLSPPWETPREQTLGCPKPYLNCRKTYITFPKKKKKRLKSAAQLKEHQKQRSNPTGETPPSLGTGPRFARIP